MMYRHFEPLIESPSRSQGDGQAAKANESDQITQLISQQSTWRMFSTHRRGQDTGKEVHT